MSLSCTGTRDFFGIYVDVVVEMLVLVATDTVIGVSLSFQLPP